MRLRRWLAWKSHQIASWAHTQSALWLSWEQGTDWLREPLTAEEQAAVDEADGEEGVPW